MGFERGMTAPGLLGPLWNVARVCWCAPGKFQAFAVLYTCLLGQVLSEMASGIGVTPPNFGALPHPRVEICTVYSQQGL